MITSPISAGNNFIAEQDITQTLEDGRVILLAAKGAAVPMALAQRLGLPELQAKGITQVDASMQPSAGPGGFTLGLSADQVADLEPEQGAASGNKGQGQGPSTTKDAPKSGQGKATGPSEVKNESLTPGAQDTDGDGLPEAPGALQGIDVGEPTAPPAAGPEGEARQFEPSSSSPSGFVNTGVPGQLTGQDKVVVLDLHQSVAGTAPTTAGSGSVAGGGSSTKAPAGGDGKKTGPKAAQ